MSKPSADPSSVNPSTEQALSFTVHEPPRLDPQEVARRTQGGRLKMLLILLACAAPVIASYFTYYVIRPSNAKSYGTLIQPTRALPPDLRLRALDAQGQTAAVETPPQALHRQWLLITVGPSTCNADCEARLFLQRQLREMVGKERDRVDKLWLIPDDGPVAPALLEALNQGEPPQLYRVDAAALQQWLQAEAGQPLSEHLYLVDPMGEWMMRFPANPDPKNVKRDLDKLLRASAFWDQAGR